MAWGPTGAKQSFWTMRSNAAKFHLAKHHAGSAATSQNPFPLLPATLYAVMMAQGSTTSRMALGGGCQAQTPMLTHSSLMHTQGYSTPMLVLRIISCVQALPKDAGAENWEHLLPVQGQPQRRNASRKAFERPFTRAIGAASIRKEPIPRGARRDERGRWGLAATAGGSSLCRSRHIHARDSRRDPWSRAQSLSWPYPRVRFRRPHSRGHTIRSFLCIGRVEAGRSLATKSRSPQPRNSAWPSRRVPGHGGAFRDAIPTGRRQRFALSGLARLETSGHGFVRRAGRLRPRVPLGRGPTWVARPVVPSRSGRGSRPWRGARAAAGGARPVRARGSVGATRGGSRGGDAGQRARERRGPCG